MQAIYYPRAMSIIGGSTIPPDILATDFYQSTRVNLEQAQAAGFNTRLINVGVDWNVVREEIAGTKRPSAIAGQSWYGLNSGAKQSVDHNYLALAEASQRVRVFPLHNVVSIEEIAIGKRLFYRVLADEITEFGEVRGRRTFLCHHLFLGAGSIGTTKLLLKAKAAGTLSNLSDQVGQNWAGNGDYVVVRVGLPDNNPGTGGPCGHFVLEDYLEQNVDLSNPTVPPPNGIVELVTPPHFVAQTMDVLMLGNPSTFVGMGIHPVIGSIGYDPITDEITVNHPVTDPALQPFLAAAQNTLDTLDAENQGAFNPFTLVNNPSSTAHPLGGAVMGEVCDQFGRVQGHPGLYVIDGALIRGLAGCVNPAWTVAAIAERCLEEIIATDIIGSQGTAAIRARRRTVRA
jgi:cholesterol oxidase